MQFSSDNDNSANEIPRGLLHGLTPQSHAFSRTIEIKGD